MWETYGKSGRQAYLIELVVRDGGLLRPIIETENDGVTPQAFKSRLAAKKRVDELLDGETTFTIVAYSVRKFSLVKKVEA